MKEVKYFCPIHPETLLYEEQVTLAEIGLKLASSTLNKFSKIFPIFKHPLAEGVGYISIGAAEGPFVCDKCNKPYHKWECLKK